jgi:hypothetical protein
MAFRRYRRKCWIKPIAEEVVRRMKKRALRIAIPVVVLVVVAGSLYAFFAGNGSLSGGQWKTASGASLQVPTAGAPSLVFTDQPAAGTAIQAGAGVFSVSVAIQDSHGTTLTSDSVDTVTLALDHNQGHGTLRCTNPGGLTATVSAGQATFGGCSISAPGPGYRLTAASSVKPALAPPANGHAFDVVTTAAARAGARTATLKARTASPGRTAAVAGPKAVVDGAGNPGSPGNPAPATELSITTPTITGAATASPGLGPITVELTTDTGRPATTGATVQLSSSSAGTDEFSASSGGTPVTSVVIPPGASAVTVYYGDELTGQPVITASAGGLEPATQTETITASPAAGLSFTGASTGNATSSRPARVTCSGGGSSPSCRVSPAPPRGKSRFMTAQVQLVDQFGNVVTNSSGPAVDVSLTPSGGSSLSTSSVTIPAGATSSAPFTEQLADGNQPGTVSATATVGSGSVTASLTS